MIALATLVAVQSVATAADSEDTVQPRHPHKVYIDNDNARIYIWKTGVYLYFSTEDGQVAKKYQLINKDSAGQATVSSFFLDQEGLNTIIEPNPKNRSIGKDKLSEFHLYGDWTAPKSGLTNSEKDHVVVDSREILGVPYELTLTSKDKSNGSGVEAQYTSVNDMEYEAYESPLTINYEGLYTIRYYAVDNVGNVEKVNTKLYGLDMTPPTTEHKILSGNVEDILSPRAVVSLVATDNMAGVKETNYFFNSDKQSVYNKTVSVSKLPEGEHELKYHSHDRVLNQETTIVYPFYLDRTAPVTVMTISGDRYFADKNIFVSGRSKINLNATDNKVDVKAVYYDSNKQSAQVYTEPFSLVQSKINHMISYWSEDVLDNKEKVRTKNITLDIEQPTVGNDYEGEYFQARGIDYINASTVVVFKASDKLSGVQSVNFSIDDGAERDGQNGFQLTNHGAYSLSYYAIDNVNNLSETKYADIFVDTEAPNVSHEFGVKNLDGETEKISDENGTFPEKVYLFLYGSDEDSGVKIINYSINNGPEKSYSNPIDFDKEGDYSVSVTAVDNVGNTFDETINFSVTTQ